jgi:GntR family transcriptional regulator
VRDALVEYFEENGARPGDRVLSEPEIVEQFRVGRSTAREALKLLEHDGIVEVRPGLGRFLTSLSAATVNRPITRFESASDMLRELGYRAQTLVLSVEEGVPTETERTALGLDEGEPVIRVERLRSEGDSPLVYSVATVVRAQVPGPARHIDWSGSITTFLKDQGRELSFSTATIHAVEMPAETATKYSLGGFGPWIFITETAYSISGEPTLYAQDYHRGDLFSFNVLRR